ncbi:leucine-rich repeat and WD repeat-containing protein 1 [Aplochiton taeniatus]
MGKITEQLVLESCTPKTNNLKLIKTLNLSKLGLKSQDLPVPLLSRMNCLEQLDLSGNRLQELPSGLVLPSLRFLDLTNNEMEDILNLESLTNLEELKIEENVYITVNDNYKLMVLLPKLRIYNGKDVSTTANHMRFIYTENLRSRVAGVWESSFSLPDDVTAEKMSVLERDFVNKVNRQIKYGPSSLTDYTKWRLERIAKEYLRSLIEPTSEEGETVVDSDPEENNITATPIKRKAAIAAAECNMDSPQKKTRLAAQAPLTEASPRKSSRLQSTPQKGQSTTDALTSLGQAARALLRPTKGQVTRPNTAIRDASEPEPEADTTPSKQSKTPTKSCIKATRTPNANSVTPGNHGCSKSQESVSLRPLHALQCHSKQDNPDDFSTQLWACAFQPPLEHSNANAGSRIVATCGGESLCLIDCETGLVMKKYNVAGEEFFSLAWSTVLMSGQSGGKVRPCSILAAGGKRGLVKLIHPRANTAYGEFRAGRKALSILRFSPRQGNFLFTGGYDKKIFMWDIGGIDSEYNFKVLQLLVLEATSPALHLSLPPNSPDRHLLAACEDGLLCYNTQLNKNTMKRSEEMEITFPIYDNEDKEHNYHTIDGLQFLSEDIVASKSHMQGSIYLWSWSATHRQKVNKKKQVCAVILTELQWCSTEIPYLTLNTCPSEGYVVCGDDKGRLWTYHVTDLIVGNFKSGKSVKATEILEWPSPVKKGGGPVEGPSINSVAMDPELQYLVALSDKNMVLVWKREILGKE